MNNLFGRFDNIFYNKEFSPFRSLIFTQVQISHLSKLIKKLDYETNFSMPNYRLGIRYFNNTEREFYWKTSNNGKMRTPFWSKDDHQYLEYDKKMYFTDKMIEKNCFSHLKKNRKPSFYYKIPEYFREDYDEYNNSLINLYKMNETYGLSKKIYSNSVWFDLDNHNLSEKNESTIKLKKLLEILKIEEKDLYYIEGNYFSGGIHCVIKLPYEVNQKFYSVLEDKLNKLGCSIECDFTNKVLRLPCSYEYLPLIKGNIVNKNYFEEEDFTNNIIDYINNIEEKEVNSSFLNEIFKETSPKKYEKIKSKLQLDTLRKEIDKNNPWNGYWDNSRKLFVKELSSEKISNFKKLYNLTNGKRHETFKKLIPYMTLRGYSLENVLKTLQELNIDSKDMNHFDKLITDITKFYYKCKKNLKITPKGIYQKYISNKDNLSKITLDFFDNEDFKRFLVQKFIKNYIEVRNYHNHTISEEKLKIFELEIPYMVKEIIGKMYYHINHRKHFKKESMEVYNGFQLSVKELELIQEQCIKDLHLENCLYNKTNIQYLKKALLKTLDIEEIKVYKHYRNWINGSCKSFRINSENDVRNVLIHLYNSCFNNIVNKNFILNSNNIYILYISLIDNWDIWNKDEIDLILKNIPEDFNTS